MTLLRFFTVSGLALLLGSTVALLLGRAGAPLPPEPTLIALGAFGTLLLAPLLLVPDEEEAIIAGKGISFSLIVFAVATMLLVPGGPTAILSLVALLFYVFVYTIWLKRRTPQNIVIGGAAGAFPPMVGWAAVTGDISAASAMMFAVIFMWTPPHFWALSLRLKDDYTEAGVPMLPVAHGPAETRVQIVVYSVVLVLVTLALAPAADLYWAYLPAAVVLGAGFIRSAFLLWRFPAKYPPIGLYKYSLIYLALLFVAMGIDAALLG